MRMTNVLVKHCIRCDGGVIYPSAQMVVRGRCGCCGGEATVYLIRFDETQGIA